MKKNTKISRHTQIDLQAAMWKWMMMNIKLKSANRFSHLQSHLSKRTILVKMTNHLLKILVLEKKKLNLALTMKIISKAISRTKIQL